MLVQLLPSGDVWIWKARAYAASHCNWTWVMVAVAPRSTRSHCGSLQALPQRVSDRPSNAAGRRSAAVLLTTRPAPAGPATAGCPRRGRSARPRPAAIRPESRPRRWRAAVFFLFSSDLHGDRDGCATAWGRAGLPRRHGAGTRPRTRDQLGERFPKCYAEVAHPSIRQRSNARFSGLRRPSARQIGERSPALCYKTVMDVAS